MCRTVLVTLAFSEKIKCSRHDKSSINPMLTAGNFSNFQQYTLNIITSLGGNALCKIPLRYLIEYTLIVGLD